MRSTIGREKDDLCYQGPVARSVCARFHPENEIIIPKTIHDDLDQSRRI